MIRSTLSPLVCFAAALALPYLAFCADASSAPQTRTLSEIIVKTADAAYGKEAADYVLSHISSAKGSVVSASGLASDVKLLLDTGIFSDVDLHLEEKDGGLVAVFCVKVAPRLKTPLSIKGNHAFSLGKIRNLLNLKDGDRIDRARLDKAIDSLKEGYRKSYYNNAKILSSIGEADESGFASVSIEIDEGEREKIADIIIKGNKAVDTHTLKKILGKPGKLNPLAPFYTQWRVDAFNPSSVREKIEAFYRSKGHLDIRTSKPEISIGEKGRPVLEIEIDEGMPYRLQSLSFSGITLFPEEEISKAAKDILPVGEIASLTAIEAVSKSVRDFYGLRGYADTAVSAKLIPREAKCKNGDNLLSVSLEVKEGILATIKSVRISGNTHTKDKVVRRELLVTPGMLLNGVLAETSRRRIENLGFFESVRVRDIPDPENPALREIVYDVKEKSTGTLMLGIGTSNVDDFLAYVDISQNNFDFASWPNFRGGGQKLRLTASVGSSSNSGEISWTDPWFMDRQQSLSLSVYRREYSFSEYDETRIGADGSFTVPLKYGRLSARLGFEMIENDEFLQGDFALGSADGAPFRFDGIEEKYKRLPLRLSWLYDTRNHPFVPTRGTRNNFFVELQSASLGSDYDVFKAGMELRQYVPSFIGDHYLSFRLRLESVDSFSSGDYLPMNELYFLGGARSVRGFRHRQIGPKAIPVDNSSRYAHPVGGRTLALFSAEYAVPVSKMFRLAAFYDTGNVWEKSFDADFSELASSWGFGIRLDVPGFPIRLDYAIPIERDDEYSRTERFVFSIGFE